MNNVLTIFVIWVTVIAGALYGWIINIVTLAHMCCEVSGMLILRAVGIFIFPLGVVMGYIS